MTKKTTTLAVSIGLLLTIAIVAPYSKGKAALAAPNKDEQTSSSAGKTWGTITVNTCDGGLHG